jgi:sensor histidine kinase YesM
MKLGSIETEADCFRGVTTSLGEVQKRTNCEKNLVISMRKILMRKILSTNFLLVVFVFCIIFVIVAYPISIYLLSVGLRPLYSQIVGILLGHLAAWAFVILTVKKDRVKKT